MQSKVNSDAKKTILNDVNAISKFSNLILVATDMFMRYTMWKKCVMWGVYGISTQWLCIFCASKTDL